MVGLWCMSSEDITWQTEWMALGNTGSLSLTGGTGGLLFGNTSLSYVDYKPTILSGLCPVYNKDKNRVELEIQNFGLSASKSQFVRIEQNGKLMVSKKIKSLAPYEKMKFSLTPEQGEWKESSDYQIGFYCGGKIVGKNNFSDLERK